MDNEIKTIISGLVHGYMGVDLKVLGGNYSGFL